MTEAAIHILLIEDNPADARLIREMMAEAGMVFDLDWTTDLAKGLGRLAAGSGDGGVDVVLLDLTLPDSSGLETFTQVFCHAASVPIIVLLGLSDETIAVQAMQAGAQDYLVKGQVDPNLLCRSVRYAIERKRVQERIGRNEKLLADAQQIAQIGSWEWDIAGDRVSWSDELYRIYGFEPQQFGATFEAYLARVHPEDRARVMETVARAVRDHEPFDFEERVVRTDGSIRILRSRGEIAVDRWGRAVRLIGACQDITERKSFELELARARDAALQSARLKSAFVANMSHEIRTPLNIILGYSAIISEKLSGLEDQSDQPLIDGVRLAAKRLMETIDEILDISRIETGNFEVKPVRLELRPLIERQVEDFRPLALEKGLSLSCSIAQHDATVRFDEYCLSHALINLLQNAIKFTKQGGVQVALGRDPEGRLCLSVRDTGVGIARAFLPNLFEPFSQEESGYTRRFEGSGLGLALTKKYLEINGACVSVDSGKGEGSVFRIHFSKASEAAGPPPESERTLRRTDPILSGAPLSEKPVILVVEDDPSNQAYIRVILEKRFEVLIAASGEEVRERLRTHLGRILMILMDLSLKGPEDGLMLTRYLREQKAWRDVPVLAVTAHVFPEDRLEATAAGCSAFLAKPFGRSDLLSTVEELFSHSGAADVPHSP